MGAVAIESGAMSRLTDREIRRFLNEKWELIENQFAPEHVILFGSRINGVPHEYSDIDMIIVSRAFADIREIWRGHHFWKTIQPHIPMTALCYTPEEFTDMRTGIGVVPDACREGVWIK